MRIFITKLCLTITVLVLASGCSSTTNNSILNDFRKSEKYSAKHNAGAKCGILIAKSGIKSNIYTTLNKGKNVAFNYPVPKSWFNCWGNNNELQITKEQCMSEHGEECFLAFYKDKDTADNRIYLYPYDDAVNKIRREQEQINKDRAEQAQQKKIDSMSKKCIAFGYELQSNQHKSCMVELYKIDNQPSITTNDSDTAAIRALLEEQKRQRQLEGSLELMKQGLEMMKQP